MKSAEREKICLNCEGRIPLDADVCPYCASHQTQAVGDSAFQAPLFDNQSLEDSLTSLYTPPYQGKRPQFDAPFGEQPLPSSPILPEEPPSSPYREVTGRDSVDPLEGATAPLEDEAPKQSSLIPMTLLLAGAQFVVIGLMQLFFSKNGVLRLEWNANYWFFYFLMSAPLFYFGHKKLKLLKD